MGFALLGKERFYGWIALAAAALVFFLVNGSLIMSFGVFLPSVCKECGWSRGALSVAYTMLIVVMMLSGPLAGWFIGKYGPRKAIITGNAMSAIGLLLLAFHSQLWQSYVAYGVLLGLGAGIGGMIAATTVASNWFVKKTPLAFGIVLGAGGLGGLVMIPLIMTIVEAIGWRSTYLVLCGITLLVGVIIAGLVIRNNPEDLGQVPDGIVSTEPGREASAPVGKQYVTPVDFTVKEALGTGAIWILIVFMNTVMFTMSILVAHQIAFLTDRGIGAGTAAATMALFSGVTTLGTLGVGFLALKFNLKLLDIIAAALMLIGMIVALLTRSLPMAFAYTILVGIGLGAALAAGISFVPAYFGRTHYSKIIGISAVFGIIGNTGAPIAGAIYDATKSYTIPFIMAVVVSAIGLFCMLILRPPLHPSLKSAKG